MRFRTAQGDGGATGAESGAASPSVTASAWAPLGVPLFRALWTASLVSFIGTFMHEVGEGWLMTSLTRSPALVALVPTAVSLPIFLFSLPAGALADVIARRKMLVVSQAWMAAIAAVLGVLTYAHLVTPAILLTLAFLLGTGAAITIPPWQASMPDWVPPVMLPAAVALGSVAFNVARGVGPMLGGVVMGAWGPGAVFFLNALRSE